MLIHLPRFLTNGHPVTHHAHTHTPRLPAPTLQHQGLLTFAYISLVSVLGERIAYGLRGQLFSALLAQDMSFFDENRTGELVGRLTNDVAEFKHAFKSCVSQVGLLHETGGGCIARGGVGRWRWRWRILLISITDDDDDDSTTMIMIHTNDRLIMERRDSRA